MNKLKALLLLFCLLHFTINQNFLYYHHNHKTLHDRNINNLPLENDYEMYICVLNLGSTFCLTEAGNKDYCNNKIKSLNIQNVLTLHGLWPNMKTGAVNNQSNASGVPYTPPTGELEDKMKHNWPSLKGGNSEFWTHEYNKHGSLYVKKEDLTSSDQFFQRALDLYTSFNGDSLLRASLDVQPGKFEDFTYSQLESKFSSILGGIFFEFTCTNHDGVQYFTDIRMYYDLTFQRLMNFKLHTNCHKDKTIRVLYDGN
jgi:ribonuclease I